MEPSTLTINNLPEVILHDTFFSYFEPKKVLHLSYVCKKWKGIVDCPLLWERIGKEFAQILLLRESQIIPQEKCTLLEYKSRIRTSVEYTTHLFQTILERIFPNVKKPHLKVIDPHYFNTYLEYLRKKEIESIEKGLDYWHTSCTTGAGIISEFKTFLRGNNHPLKILSIFISRMEDHIARGLKQKEPQLINYFILFIKHFIIHEGKIELLQRCIELAKSFIYITFSHTIYKLAYRYVSSYQSNTLGRMLFVSNAEVFHCFVQFLDEVKDDTIFLQKIAHAEIHLFSQNNTNADELVDKTKYEIVTILSHFNISN